MAKRDYYEVLGVSRDADNAALKKAFRSLAREHHPDRNQGDPGAEGRFKEASEAYGVLSDVEKRKRYDRMGHGAFENNGPGGFDPSDFGMQEILEGLFGGFTGRKRQKGARDLTYDLNVSFEEAALGAEKPITVERPMPCDRCSGSGGEPGTAVSECPSCRGKGVIRHQRGLFGTNKTCHICQGTGKKIIKPCTECKASGRIRRMHEMSVRIPAGVKDGAVRSVRGAGEVNATGAGDLHVTIRVDEHPLFSRDGADILCTVPVSFPQAVLGDSLEIPTLSGKVKMSLPAGTQSGKILRLRGKGIAAYGGAGKGDQLVTVLVEVPEKINRKQQRLIEELAAEMGIETMPQRASFLGKLKKLFE